MPLRIKKGVGWWLAGDIFSNKEGGRESDSSSISDNSSSRIEDV